MTLKFLAALCLAAAIPSAAMAAPVKWTLSDITFDDGGTASGSFVYDANTNTYSAISVTTTGGGMASSTYISAHAPQADDETTTLLTSTGAAANAPVVAFYYPMPLDNAGGSKTPFPTISGEGFCKTAACSSFVGNAPQRRVTSGYMTTAVPIPTVSEWTMIALGAVLAAGAALMLQRRRFAT